MPRRLPKAPSGDGVPSRRATLQRPRYLLPRESTSVGTRYGFRMAQTQTIDVGAASLECTVNGSGDPLVVLANAGCSTGYLERFGERLPKSQIIGINMRGVGASRGPLDNATLHDLASDVAGGLEALQCGHVHILGPAFDN